MSDRSAYLAPGLFAADKIEHPLEHLIGVLVSVRMHRTDALRGKLPIMHLTESARSPDSSMSGQMMISDHC